MPLDEATALAWVDAGCSVIPIKGDGTKAPRGAWKAAQSVRAARDLVAGWAAEAPGLGVVCGTVSGGLEMLELEGRAITEGYGERLREACRDNGVEALLDLVLHGCRTKSPSGGYHFWYRVTDGPTRGNTKLARRPATGDELAEAPTDKIKVLIETRGEGGFAVVPPSNGTTHASGLPWVLDEGSPATIPTITVDERDALHAVASLLDEMPVEDQQPATATAPRFEGAAKRPGDDFNERASWDEILTPAGWTKLRRFGPGWAWRRPGKDGPGMSATTGQSKTGDRLYIFTTSTELTSEKAMSKFYVYAQLQHGGDMRAATKALRADGYGDPLPPREDVRSLIAPGTSVPTSDGATALASVHAIRPEVSMDHTDDANALRLVDAHHAIIRRVSDMGQWYAWEDCRWRKDADEAHIRELARSLARSLPQDDKEDKTHKRNSLSSSGLSSTIRVASSDPRTTVRADDLDAHPHLLNTPGGILDLHTGTVGPHDPAKLLTRATTTDAHLDADHPLWSAFLEETFGGDAELIAYVQQLAGLALLGDVREHVLPLFYGSGANGKGVILLVWQALLGVADTGGYAQSAPDGFLMTGRESGHPTDIARLRGARLLVASEQTGGRRFDEAKVKRLTGGDMLTGRFMRGDFFDFKPSHLIVVATNHLPEVREGGPSFWRRARLIPFDNVVPEDRRDPEMHTRLVAAEGAAILGWMARGARSVITDGVTTPARVLAATDDYRVSEDTLASFVRDECIVGAHYQAPTSVLYVRYEAHCKEMGQEPLSQKAVGQRLVAEYGTTSAKAMHQRIHRGIGLVSSDEEPGDE